MFGIISLSLSTSFPSDAPKPPGSKKSRCISTTTNAIVFSVTLTGYGTD